MDTFLANLTTFPVVVYTFLLMLVIFYWLMAFLGIVDIDIFDADIEIETDFETEVSINPDAEGLSGLAGFMLNWGLTGVPITVVISLLIVTSWLICYLATSLIFNYIPIGIIRYVLGAGLLFVCFAVSIPLTAWSIRPIKGLFIAHTAIKKDALVGLECEVTTGKVNEEFGQASLEDGEAGMILSIRAPIDKAIKKGDKVILIEYIEKDDCYNVAKV
jgi:hypothetical protein